MAEKQTLAERIKQYEHDVDYFTRLQEENKDNQRNLQWIEPLLMKAAMKLDDALQEEKRLPYMPWYVVTASLGLTIAVIAVIQYFRS